jgi:PAS domain-containing protein
LDVTDRKRAESEIISLSKFPAENPNPVLRVQNDGRIIYANPASRELLDWWTCEIGDYLPGGIKELVLSAMEAGSNIAVDLPFNDKIYSIILVPIREAGYVNLYGRNITARKQAEEQLRYQATLLSMMRSSPPTPSIVLRPGMQPLKPSMVGKRRKYSGVAA